MNVSIHKQWPLPYLHEWNANNYTAKSRTGQNTCKYLELLQLQVIAKW